MIVVGSGSLIINRQVFRFKGFDGAYDLQLVNSTKLKLKIFFTYLWVYEYLNWWDVLSWPVSSDIPPRLKLWGDVKELPGLRSCTRYTDLLRLLHTSNLDDGGHWSSRAPCYYWKYWSQGTSCITWKKKVLFIIYYSIMTNDLELIKLQTYISS